MKNKGKIANALFFLSLLCIFVIGSVLVVSYQIIGYQKIVDGNETIKMQYTPLSYLSNKVRTHDQSARVYQIQVEDINVLCLEEDKGIVYIYEYKGYLRELYAVKGYEIDLSDGDIIFDVDDFTFKLEAETITFLVTIDNNTEEAILPLQHKMEVGR